MATLQISSTGLNSLENGCGNENFVDMDTIRRRLAAIKNRWTPETVRARAIEGARRRAELEALVDSEFFCESKAEEHGFGLVG